MKPEISVVTPVYNAITYLPPLITSMEGQTLKDFQWVIVDDGSTDGGGDLLKEAAEKDPRIALIRQENQGVSAARNTALKEVKGTYLTFLDADDYYSPEALEEVHDRMEETGAGLLIYAWYQHNGEEVDGYLFSDEDMGKDLDAVYRDVAFCVYDSGGGFPWNKAWRTDRIRGEGGFIPFDVDLSHFEDRLWILENLDASPDLSVAFLNKPLYHYFLRNGTLSHPDSLTPAMVNRAVSAGRKTASYVGGKHPALREEAFTWFSSILSSSREILNG